MVLAQLLRNRYVVYALVFIILIAAALLARKAVQNAVANSRENSFDKKDGTLTKGIDLNYFVMAYRNAFNPSGLSWNRFTDGTDEESIYTLAIKGQGHINEISKAYKQKFQESLLEALAEELDSEEFEKWRSLAY